MWEIYSIGDAGYLVSVINAVAMITGTGDFAATVKIGFAIGILLLGFQAIMKGGQGLQFNQVAVALVVYFMMFGPSTRVVVEDVYDNQVYTVDNVPFGIAATGSIMSRIGYQITRLFETAFSTPGMTEHGYGFSLKKMEDTKRAVQTYLNNSDYDRSWTNYVMECTLAAFDLGLKDMDEVFKGDLPDALRFNENNWYFTEIYVPDGNPRTLGCGEAYDQLVLHTNSTFLTTLKQRLDKHFFQTNSGGTLTEQMVQNALNGVERYNLEADDYLQSLYLTPIYVEGAIQKHQRDGDHNYAAIINQQYQDYLIKMSARRGLFDQTIRPMLTFLEAFFFAITPLMGFAIALGGFGMAIVGKYMVFALWIQLWMPTLAIINHYMHYGVANKLEGALENPNTHNFISMQDTRILDSVNGAYYAVGNDMAAATPILTMFLVTGSYYVMSRIGGAVSPDESVSPQTDSLNPGAPSRPPPMSFDMQRGMHQQAADDALPSFSWSSSDARTTASAEREMHQAGANFSQSLGQTLSKNLSTESGAQHAQSHTDLESARSAESTKALQSKGGGIMNEMKEAHGLSEQQVLKLSAHAAASGEAGVSSGDVENVTGGSAKGGKAGVRGQAGVEGNLSDTTTLSKEQQQQIATKLNETFTDDQAWQAEYGNTVAQEYKNGTTNVYSEGFGLTETDGFSREMNESVTAAQSYEEKTSSGVTASVDNTRSATVAAQAISSDDDVYNGLEDTIKQIGGNPAYSAASQYADEHRDDFGGDKKKAMAAGMLMVSKNMTPESQALGLNETQRGILSDAGNQSLAAAFGQSAPLFGNDAAANQGAADDAPEKGEVKNNTAHVEGSGTTQDVVEKTVGYGKDTVAEASNKPGLRDRHAENQEWVSDKSEETVNELLSQIRDARTDQLADRNDETALELGNNNLFSIGEDVDKAYAEAESHGLNDAQAEYYAHLRANESSYASEAGEGVKSFFDTEHKEQIQQLREDVGNDTVADGLERAAKKTSEDDREGILSSISSLNDVKR